VFKVVVKCGADDLSSLGVNAAIYRYGDAPAFGSCSLP
jgi:hypothetical protein